MKFGTFFSQICLAAELGEIKTLEEGFLRLASKGLKTTDIHTGASRELGSSYINKLHEAYSVTPASMFHLKDFDHKNPDILKIMKEDSKFQLEDCATLKSPLFMPVPLVKGPHESEEKRNDALKLVTAYINDLTELAAPYGITIVVENFSNTDVPLSYISDIEYILENVPSAKYVLDTGNFWFGGTDMLTACKKFLDKTVHVHLKDLEEKPDGELNICSKAADSVAIGDGFLPIYEALSLLKDAGYENTITIEINHSCEMMKRIEKSILNLKANIG